MRHRCHAQTAHRGIPQTHARRALSPATQRPLMDASTLVVCARDTDFLRRRDRLFYEKNDHPLRIVDLFSGCGGLSLGRAEAARKLDRGIEIPLAVDSDEDVLRVFKANFPSATVVHQLVERLFDGDIGSPQRTNERVQSQSVGEIDFLLGGPPCQGSSDLNNHTRRNDPRNALYTRIAPGVDKQSSRFSRPCATAGRSVTSTDWTDTDPAACLIFAAASSRVRCVRPHRMTCTPSGESASAAPRPIPLPPPVISATLPASGCGRLNISRSSMHGTELVKDHSTDEVASCEVCAPHVLNLCRDLT